MKPQLTAYLSRAHKMLIEDQWVPALSGGDSGIEDATGVLALDQRHCGNWLSRPSRL
jgi:hypothetical protein